MITANELRIGNLIDCFGICEVIKIGQKNIKISRETDTGLLLEKVPLNSLELKPIPITEEILMKCGFDKWNGHKYFDKNVDLDCSIQIALERNIMYLCGNDACTEGHCFELQNVKYLHQLQNLYFALTGKELEINLEQ